MSMSLPARSGLIPHPQFLITSGGIVSMQRSVSHE